MIKLQLLALGLAAWVLYAYAPAHYWPLLEAYAAAECLLLITKFLTR